MWVYRELLQGIFTAQDVLWPSCHEGPACTVTQVQWLSSPGGKIYKIPPSWDFGMKISSQKIFALGAAFRVRKYIISWSAIVQYSIQSNYHSSSTHFNNQSTSPDFQRFERFAHRCAVGFNCRNQLYFIYLFKILYSPRLEHSVMCILQQKVS